MSDDALLTTIRQQFDKIPAYGQLQIIIKSHTVTLANGSQSRIKKLEFVMIDTNKYVGQDTNVKCAADVMRLMKAITEAKLTGTVGFSITFKDGNAQTMQTQDFKKA